MLCVVKQRSVQQKGKLYRCGDRIVIKDPASLKRLTEAGIVVPLEDVEPLLEMALPPIENFTRKQMMNLCKAVKASWRAKFTNRELYAAIEEVFARDPKTVIGEVMALGV